jgi:hypothetical protein
VLGSASRTTYDDAASGLGIGTAPVGGGITSSVSGLSMKAPGPWPAGEQ